MDWAAANSQPWLCDPLIAADGCQGGRMSGLFAHAAGIEEVEKSADDPISRRDPKDEGSGNRKQEQGGEEKCRHRLSCRSVPPAGHLA